MRTAAFLVAVCMLACSSGSGGGDATGGAGGSAGSGSGGSGVCGSECTDQGFTCCGADCINIGNDPKHCGGCDSKECPAETPFCDNGTCGQPPCQTTQPCASGQTCCGTQCCSGICCAVPGPIGVEITCVNPTEHGGTCPKGCLTCKCADPDTPIATPDGERPIDSLRAGDLVYSVHGRAIVAVPVLRTNRTPVADHRILRIRLDSGAVLEVSGGHPTADGKKLEALGIGDRLGEATIVAVESVPYRRPYTVDILPDSASGSYFAGGALLGSTLFGLR